MPAITDTSDSTACTPLVTGTGLQTPIFSRRQSDLSGLGSNQRRRFISKSSKRALFTPECVPAKTKRLADEDDSTRPRKQIHRDLMPDDLEACKENIPPPEMHASLNRSLSSPGPLADVEVYTPLLPVIKSTKHPDLNVLAPSTVKKLINGDFDSVLKGGFHLVDCRFKHEYNGGTLQGAKSLALPQDVEKEFFNPPLKSSSHTALIFFCEFSAKRAPKMARHVRNLDRRLHAEVYPKLHYPELYVIDGGYKHCFESIQDLCEPCAYVPMTHKDHADACKKELSALRASWKRHQSSSKRQRWC
ncbi:cell division cycle- protein [Aphanomyces cochlioides]|nr:cell division cycle- protein [Aphanomyces cochlioides]